MNLSDLTRNAQMLQGSYAKKGCMRWWHSFCGVEPESGEARTFFVEFYIINPALGSTHPILGQHPYFKKRGMKSSYALVKAGVFPRESGTDGKQFHAFYPISSLQAGGSPLTLQLTDQEAGVCLCSEDRLSGAVEVSREEARHRSLMTDCDSMEWDLEVRKAVSCHTGALAGAFFQALNLLDSYWHGEGIRSFFQGSVTLDGVTYQVTPELSYGYADKHWGHGAPDSWFQSACGKLKSGRTGGELRHSVLAVSSYTPRFLLFRLRPRLMIQLTYMGEDFEFHRCRWETKETEKRFIWRIVAKNRSSVVKVTASCRKEEMMPLRYENPLGTRPGKPLQGSASGTGTVQIFRKISGERELVDTLTLESALCLWDACTRPDSQ